MNRRREVNDEAKRHRELDLISDGISSHDKLKPKGRKGSASLQAISPHRDNDLDARASEGRWDDEEGRGYSIENAELDYPTAQEVSTESIVWLILDEFCIIERKN